MPSVCRRDNSDVGVVSKHESDSNFQLGSHAVHTFALVQVLHFGEHATQTLSVLAKVPSLHADTHVLRSCKYLVPVDGQSMHLVRVEHSLQGAAHDEQIDSTTPFVTAKNSPVL